MKIRLNVLSAALEMADIFKVEVKDGKKKVHRWGFYVKEGNGDYAIYTPTQIEYLAGEKPAIEDEPGDIHMVKTSAISTFLSEIKGDLRHMDLAAVTPQTECGWYYCR